MFGTILRTIAAPILEEVAKSSAKRAFLDPIIHENKPFLKKISDAIVVATDVANTLIDRYDENDSSSDDYDYTNYDSDIDYDYDNYSTEEVEDTFYDTEDDYIEKNIEPQYIDMDVELRKKIQQQEYSYYCIYNR